MSFQINSQLTGRIIRKTDAIGWYLVIEPEDIGIYNIELIATDGCEKMERSNFQISILGE